MKFLLLLVCISSLFLSSCKHSGLENLPLKHPEGTKSTPAGLLGDKKGLVFVFLAPDCPLSQYYTLPLRLIFENYHEKISMAGIIPGKFYSMDEINQYKERYRIPFDLFLDDDLKLTNQLKASVTPEVFLLDENLHLVYSGAIDDAAVDLTVKKQVVRNHYLKNAVDGLLNHQPSGVRKTKAVGCIIERRR
jgi:hypothetical protein